MRKQILLFLLITAFSIQSLSAMLIKALAPNLIRRPVLLKYARSMATKEKMSPATSTIKPPYLERYPHLNLLPGRSFLRLACEKEAELTHESQCILYHNFIPMSGPIYNPSLEGSELLWNLDER